MRLRFVLIAFVLLAFVPTAYGQDAARLVGRVLNEQTGSPVVLAEIAVVGTVLRTTTGPDGRFVLTGIPAAAWTLDVRAIGFTRKRVTNVVLRAGEARTLDVTLAPAVFEVEAIEVTVDVQRGTVSQTLDLQRNAAGVVSGISSEQIRRSPDGDASQAIQRVSGVSVQDGRYVFVRGLGERYTTTELNGARVPSPEPEKKIVPLDLFPSDLLESITTVKTFTPERPGDFSGAQVNLRTKEFPADRTFSISLGSGFNDAAMGVLLPGAPTIGREWLGFAGSERQLPALAVNAGTLQGVSREDMTALIRSFRNAWSSERSEGRPLASFGLTLGGEDPLFGQRIGYSGSLTYSYAQEVRRDERRAIAQPGTMPGIFDVQNAYAGSTGRASVLWGGMLNLSTRVGTGTKLSLNNTYTRSGDNEANHLAGLNEGFDVVLDLTRLTFVERSVLSNQLNGQHLVGGRHLLDWAVTRSVVERNEPDRSDLAYVTTVDSSTGLSDPQFWFGAPRSATRTFSALDERGWVLDNGLTLGLGNPALPTYLKIGGYHRRVDREADTRLFDILNVGLTEAQRAAPAESLFATSEFTDRLAVFANARAGRYTASDRLWAGYLQLEIPLGSRLQVIGGARLEHSAIEVLTVTVDGSETPAAIWTTDLLPSLGLNLRATSQHVVRLAASQTLARPEYRELSPVAFFDILGGQRLFGNADLERSLIRNGDLRWEWYPRPGEVLSIGVFAKHFQRPIERVSVQTSDGNSPDATFVNAESARNYGVELEVRKRLDVVAGALDAVSLFANATLMESRIRPGNDGISSLTNASRAMVGQAEYVMNAGVTYLSRSGRFGATALYNVVGPRIVEAGILPLPDVFEEERHILDLSLHLPFMLGAGLKLDAKNLLDEPVRLTQGTVERLHYRTGRVFKASFKWGF